MDNYICVNGKHIELTEDQIDQIVEARNSSKVRLSSVPAGEAIKLGPYDFIVLEQTGGTAELLCRDLIGEAIKFGDNNNYDGSAADKACCAFYDEIARYVGVENIVKHAVDLTADDGLDDYGVIYRYCSMFTAKRAREHVYALDKYPVKKWWWLATAFSTPAHGNDSTVKCVSPSGCIDNYGCYYNNDGVRPFLILKSDIFVSR